MKRKIIRATTVPSSPMNNFSKGELKDLNRTYEIVALSSPGDDLDEVAEHEGVRTIAISMKRTISILHDMVSLIRVTRTIRREKPYMVHSMTPKAGLLCMIGAWLNRVPVRVHTFTGLVFPTQSGLKRRLLMTTDAITCACATHVIPEGEGVKNDLISHHITKKPLRVLGYGNCIGIDLELFNPELFRKEASSIFTFIFVGRLVGDKGINELVLAFKRLNVECPQTKLVLVGDEEAELDPIKPETRTEIERNPAIDAVGFQKDVRPFYAAADALAFPSYREGFPNVVIEAGAMSLPSIVTDINGSREIIRENVNGTIVPAKDVEQLYKAMKRFVEQPKEVKRMAANARPLIASRYEQSYVRQCLKDFYEEVMQ